MPSVLDEIVAATRERIAEAKLHVDLRELADRAARHSARGFRRALASADARGGIAVIAELKQASPSKGVIRANLHIAPLAAELQRSGAAALSVLTEPQYFQGSLANLSEASAAANLPCLRKDFIVDEFQLLEATAHGADAVLLIASVLGDGVLEDMHGKAITLGLDVLCEVHDTSELQRALAAGCNMVGVNSRDLRNFSVDLQTSIELARHMPPNVLPVAESGIHTGEDIAALRAAGYRAFLIGESLMRAASPGQALASLMADAKAKYVVDSR